MAMAIKMKINPEILVRNAQKWLLTKQAEINAGNTVKWMQIYGWVEFKLAEVGGLKFTVHVDDSFQDVVPVIEDALGEVKAWFDNL